MRRSPTALASHLTMLSGHAGIYLHAAYGREPSICPTYPLGAGTVQRPFPTMTRWFVPKAPQQVNRPAVEEPSLAKAAWPAARAPCPLPRARSLQTLRPERTDTPQPPQYHPTPQGARHCKQHTHSTEQARGSTRQERQETEQAKRQPPSDCEHRLTQTPLPSAVM